MANRSATRIEKLEAIEKVEFYYTVPCAMIFLHRTFDVTVACAEFLYEAVFPVTV